MLKPTVLFALVFQLFVQSCSYSSTRGTIGEPQQVSAKVAKVRVDRNGDVFLDGKPVSVEELRRAFSELKKTDGSVWYYRENPEAEPPPHAMEVIQAVIDAGLPIRLSTRPDYSDVTGAEAPVPR